MPPIKGDATQSESVAAVSRGQDAVVSAISPRPNARGLATPSLVTNAQALIAGLPKAGVKRVLMVGGAGSLEIAPGERTGRYRTTLDTVLFDAAGKSFITFEDLAVAIVDELEEGAHIGRRFGVAY